MKIRLRQKISNGEVTMKKTYAKSIVRSIKGTFSRFVAIFAITALGVGFLAGLLSTTPDMRRTIDNYYDEYDMMDIFVKSTYGFNDDDIEAVKAVDGINTVMPHYNVDTLVTVSDDALVARIYGLDFDNLDIGKMKLVEGRYPENANEIVAEQGNGMFSHLKLGEKITIIGDTGEDISETYTETELTVVGIVINPLYMSIERENSTKGNGRVGVMVYASEELYKLDVYTDLFITAKGAKELDTYSKKYDELVERVTASLENVAEVRSSARIDEIRTDAESELEDAEREYNEKRADAERELDEANQKLIDAERELEDGEKELEKAQEEIERRQNEIEDGRKAIADGKAEIDRNRQTIADGQAEIDAGRSQLDSALSQLNMTQEQLNEQKKQIEDQIAEINAGYTQQLETIKIQLEAALAQINDSLAQIDTSRAELDRQYEVLRTSEAELEAARRQLTAAEAEIAENESALLDGERQLEDAQKEIDEAKQKLIDGRNELADGRDEYNKSRAEADEEFAKAEKELADAREEIKKLKAPEWYVLDRNSTVGYVSFDSNADKIAAIAKIFPLFFFLVAALVALTTMTRMIEEERTQIGILKALGYSRGAIMSKYIIYAGLSGLLGSGVGLAIGLYLFPMIIWNAYKIMYTFPPLQISFIPEIALMSAAVAIACTLAATLWAGAHILSEKPATLLLPRAPKAGKRVLLERVTPIWKHLSFNQKVTVRNLFRYKKRFFMTVIGIAGCTALLVTGFGLRDSIGDIVNKQYNELMQYNLSIVKSDSSDDITTLDEYLNSDKVSGFTAVHSEYGEIRANGESVNVYLTIPENPDNFTDFMLLRNRKGKKALEFNESSVILSEKMASIIKASVGDSVELENANGETAIFTVTGITENYVMSYVYLSQDMYTSKYDSELDFNNLYVKSNADGAAGEDAEATYLLSLDSVSSVSFTTSMSESFDNMLGKIDYIVIVLIICAGLLVFVVLYNLTNINIAEREKELATIKVLGFYDGEVAAYVYRETAALSAIGTAVGLVLGIFLHRFVILTAEVDSVMFGRAIYAQSYIISAVITLIFSALVCLFMAKKLRDIDMVESMKAGE
ncbi:MAG: FtsX-like permease family protein [Clostridiales bacterium]|nr:FtsX-like permease family protein [Clostridiales bacterium]